MDPDQNLLNSSRVWGLRTIWICLEPLLQCGWVDYGALVDKADLLGDDFVALVKHFDSTL